MHFCGWFYKNKFKCCFLPFSINMQLACTYKWCISNYFSLLLKYRDFISFAFLWFFYPLVFSMEEMIFPAYFRFFFPAPFSVPHEFNAASCTVCLKRPHLVSVAIIFLENRVEIFSDPTKLSSACHKWVCRIDSKWRDLPGAEW